MLQQKSNSLIPFSGLLNSKEHKFFLLYCLYFLVLFSGIGVFFTYVWQIPNLLNQGDYYRQLYRLGMWYEHKQVWIDHSKIGLGALKFNSNDLLYYPLIIYTWFTGGHTISIQHLFWIGLFYGFLGACYSAWLLWPLGTRARMLYLVIGTLIYIDPLYIMYKKSCYQESMMFILLVPFLTAVFYEKRLGWFGILGTLFFISKVQDIVFVALLITLLIGAYKARESSAVGVYVFLAVLSVCFMILSQKAINGTRINPPNAFFYGLLYQAPSTQEANKIYTDFKLERTKYQYLENKTNVGIYDVPFHQEYWPEFSAHVSVSKIAVYYIVHPLLLGQKIGLLINFAKSSNLFEFGLENREPLEDWPSFSTLFKNNSFIWLFYPILALVALFKKKKSLTLAILPTLPFIVVYLALIGDGFNEILKHIHLSLLLAPCILLFWLLEMWAIKPTKHL